jgi:amidohydrolase
MSKLNVDALKLLITKDIDKRRRELRSLSLKIHAHPELGYKEVKAAAWLEEYLEQRGFSVERGVYGLPTAFRASYGTGRPAVALLAEYDALPGVGHACGHNLIAGCAVGAAVASRLAVDRLGGCVLVFGTPAEELFGGKMVMVRQGAFSDVDAVMMVHPGSHDIAVTEALACIGLDVEFFGKSAHASAQPEQGINALEAMILSFNAINSLRQHIRSSARIHGIITDGGEAANVVPAHSAGNFIVRARDDAYLEELMARTLDCFTAAAAATGARLKYRWSDLRYAPLRNNPTLARLFRRNLQVTGRRVYAKDPTNAVGSTDMGNVSQVAPGIHPNVAICLENILAHSPEFAAAAASDAGIAGMLDAARALAGTIVDLLSSPETVKRVRLEFARQ